VLKYVLVVFMAAATLCTAATQRVPGSRVIIDTTGFDAVEPSDATLQGILDWIDNYWPTPTTSLSWDSITNTPSVWPGTIPFSNVTGKTEWTGTIPFSNVTGKTEWTGTVNFASVTNLPRIYPGYATGLYSVVTYGTVTNTSFSVTNGPNMVIIPVGTNVVFSMATNGFPALFDGYCLKWRLTATGGTRTVYFPTNTFRIPYSSSMATNQVISNGVVSVFLTEYNASKGRWMVQSYFTGF
jgi:hypothetical protein